MALHGWKLYAQHPIRNAGLGLAFLYMTVLGFDNITYGFCLSQCITESVLGALVGVSAIFGVMGSLCFPILRKYVGLKKTGLIGMCALVSVTSLCVASIWLDGSPFDPFFLSRQPNEIKIDTLGNNVTNGSTTMAGIDTSTGHLFLVEANATTAADFKPSNTDEAPCYVPSFVSVAVLLAGIIMARFGLWISDLTITQILQESLQSRYV